jgi:type I restriction enzyme S subunit
MASESVAKYKQTEIGMIPVDWDVKQLGDIGESLIGLTYKPSDVNHEGILVLRSSNIQNDKLSFEDNVYVDVDIPEKIRVKNGDILVCVRNGSRNLIGKCSLLDSRVEGQTFGAFMAVFRTEYYKFVFRQFQSNNIQRQINENIGATINQITNKNLNSFKIAFPSKEAERFAIGATLSDVDALISKLEVLLQKKKLIKQGAMQELLTGKRRLPGFSGEWEKKKLGDLAKIKTGSRNNQDKVEGGQYPFFVRSANVERINDYSYDCEAVLVPGEGNIGKIFHYIIGRFDVHQRVYAITSFIQEVSGRFIFYYMDKNFGVHAMQNTVKATVDSLRLPTFENFELVLPPTKKEQVAIASVLSDIDMEIENLESKLSKYQDLKQGMMQVLLTGKIRLI